MKKLRITLTGLAALLVAAQFIRPERTNPPADPAASFEAVVKPSRTAAGVIERSCRDCHTNRTVWPWYSRLAPASWLVARDVKQGRAHLNFSQWNIYGDEMSRMRLRDVCGQTRSGEMPPKYYTPLHRGARLTGADVWALCALGGS